MKRKKSLPEVAKRIARTAKKLEAAFTPSVELPTGAVHGTASKRGWSYFKSWATCPRQWFLKYVARLAPPSDSSTEPGGRADGRMTGTLYHGLILGTHATDPAWAELARLRPDLLAYARELAAVRLRAKEDGTLPLPKATAVEKELTVPGMSMTSKPDQVEIDPKTKKKVARDLKALKSFGAQDILGAEVDGQFIAEALAVGATKVIVDVIKKTKTPVPLTVEVALTPHKEQFLRAQVESSEREMHNACDGWAKGMPYRHDAPAHELTEHEHALALFPPRLNACVQRGVCDFYEFCHGGEFAKAQFTVRPDVKEPDADS